MMKELRMNLSGGTVVAMVLAVVVSAYGQGKDGQRGTPDAAATPTVQIGTQVWMARNVDATVDAAGKSLDGMPYNGDKKLAATYGRLYTFKDARRACPAGFHLPSIQEWSVLVDHLGGIKAAGGKMKTVEGWKAPNTGATNQSGFSGVPGGGCANFGQCDGLGWAAHFWSSTSDGQNAQVPSLMHDIGDLYVLSLNVSMRASVRCLRD